MKRRENRFLALLLTAAMCTGTVTAAVSAEQIVEITQEAAESSMLPREEIQTESNVSVEQSMAQYLTLEQNVMRVERNGSLIFNEQGAIPVVQQGDVVTFKAVLDSTIPSVVTPELRVMLAGLTVNNATGFTVPITLIPQAGQEVSYEYVYQAVVVTQEAGEVSAEAVITNYRNDGALIRCENVFVSQSTVPQGTGEIVEIPQETQPGTEVVEMQTEAVTEAVTEAATEAVTEAATEAVTEAAAEAVTEVPVQLSAEITTETAETMTETMLSSKIELQTESETNFETETQMVGIEEASETESETEVSVSARSMEKEVDGWVQESGHWYYYRNGVKCYGFQFIDGKVYYLDPETGIMATGWKKIDGNWYYFAAGGQRRYGFQFIGGKVYYLDSQTGIMATGWKKIDGNWYYFAASGSRCYGFQFIGGKVYYLDSQTGIMATGWKKIDGYWYYFAAGGSRCYGFQFIKGTVYYLDRQNGRMATGWVTDGEEKYYFDNNGHRCYGFRFIDGYVYCFDPQSGAMYVSTVKKVDGKYYAFDSAGKRMYGLVNATSGHRYYFNTSSGVMMSDTEFTYNNQKYYCGSDSIVRKYRAILIGERYQGTGSELGGPGNDANAIRDILTTTKGNYTIDCQIEASKSAIYTKLVNAVNVQNHSDDITMFYYSGHGVTSAGTYSGALCTVEADGGIDYITTAELATQLKKVSGQVYVLLDSCGSGAAINKDVSALTGNFDPAVFGESVNQAFQSADETIIPENTYGNEVVEFEEEVSAQSGEMCTSKFNVLTAATQGDTSLDVSLGTMRAGLFTLGVSESVGRDYETGSWDSEMDGDINNDGKLTMQECFNYVDEFCDGYQVTCMYTQNSNATLFFK